MELNFNLLKLISETPGVSGYEKKIREQIKNEVKSYSDNISIDSIGNLIVEKKGIQSDTNIMIAAHMDEIGFIVNHIDENGYIKFYPLGGFDPKTLTSQHVIVHGKEDLLGAIGSKPIHLMKEAERKKSLDIDDFFIDLGLSRQEVQNLVPIGSPVSRKKELLEMGNCVSGKSLDNRVSVYILIEVIKRLKEIPYNLFAVFTTQEEVGLRGAKVASTNINPNFGIALDTTIANDTPNTKNNDSLAKLGNGVGIKILDKSVICDTRLVKFLEDIAKKNDIKYQYDMKMAGGTDTSALQLEGTSISGAISIPTRYLHQTVETVNKEDIKSAIKLLKLSLENFENFAYEF